MRHGKFLEWDNEKVRKDDWNDGMMRRQFKDDECEGYQWDIKKRRNWE